ncbi:MAG: ATP-binding protein [Bacteroidetes bacterium]|nr:ATP-binding protein [Bacteroidota bacterium]
MKKFPYLLKLFVYTLPVILAASFILISSGTGVVITFLIAVFLILIVAAALNFRFLSAVSYSFSGTSDKIRKNTEKLEEYDEKIQAVVEIRESFSELRKNFPLGKEITEIAEAFDGIIARLLAELNTAKVFKVNRNEFLGNVAHEMRTPIFAIQLSLETLSDGAIHDDNVNMDFLNKALNQSNRLKSLVDDLISISRFEAGMKLSKRFFPINHLIQETMQELQGLAEKRKVTLKFDSELKESSSVLADSERIKQVLVNLIDNSIKYTPEDGTVTVTAGKEDRNVVITVEDTGAGIPKEDLPRIFERFYRVDKTRSRDVGGSGLGLSIVKHILELHGSHISAESEEGKGTRFTFTLPS